jgi:DNA-binding protein HU-beta
MLLDLMELLPQSMQGLDKMNKGELIATIVESRNVSRQMAEKALAVFLACLVNAMKKGDRVTIFGFGSFRVVERAAKKGWNIHTGQSLEIPAHKVVKFKPGKRLVDRVQ